MEFVSALTGLRPYQRELLRKVLAALEITDRPVMMQLPTGGGKTVIAAHLLRDYLTGRRKAVWLTHRKELASQTENMLFKAGVSATCNINWKPRTKAPRIANGVVILMAQTVGRRTRDIAADVWGSYDVNDLLIIDEAHHAAAKGWERGIRQWPGKVLGMTATPWRLSRKEGFDHLFGDLILGPQVGELQNDEFLCQANVLVPGKDNLILGGKVASHLDYTEKGIEAANTKEVMTARALNFWKEHVSDRQTIIYAVSIGHARNLAAVFNGSGIAAGLILGDTSPVNRTNAIEGFRTGKLKVLVNVAVATEGFDLPDASCIVIARPTKSLSLYLQMVGRGLRPKKDGGDCLILDLAGNAFEHGLPEDTREWSLAARGESEAGGDAPVVLCEKCQTASPAASHNCKSKCCGAPFGKDCPRCGKWHAWKDWTLESCEYSHDKVGNCCHIDVHFEHNNPVGPLFLRKFVSDIDSLGKGQFVLENPNIVTRALLVTLKEMGGGGPTGEVIGRAREFLWEMDCERLGFIVNEGVLGKSFSNHIKEFSKHDWQSIEATANMLKLRQIYGDISSHGSVESRSTIYKKITAAHKQLQDSGHCVNDPRSKRWRLTESALEHASSILLQEPNGG